MNKLRNAVMFAILIGTTYALAGLGCVNTVEECSWLGSGGGVGNDGGMGGAGGAGMGGSGGMAPVCSTTLFTSFAEGVESATSGHLLQDGSFIVAGNFSGTMSLSPSKNLSSKGSAPEFFLARYNADTSLANALWLPAVFLDSAIDSQGNKVVIGTHTDEIILPDNCGTFPPQSEFFVLKFDSGDKCVWAKSYELASGTEVTARVAMGPNGDVAFAGGFSGSIKYPAPVSPISSTGAKDVFVAKLSAGGELLWANSYLGQSGTIQEARAVYVTGAGDVLFAGHYDGTLNLGQPSLGVIWSPLPAGFAAKIASDGKKIFWQKTLEIDTGTRHVTAIALTENNEVIVAGDISGIAKTDMLDMSHRLFLARLDLESGLIKSVKGYQGAGAPRIHDIVVAPDNRIVVAGHLDDKLNMGDVELGEGSVGERFFWTTMDANWENPHSNNSGDDVFGEKRAFGVAVNATHLLLVGHFEGTIKIADHTRSMGGGKDFFAAKMCLP